MNRTGELVSVLIVPRGDDRLLEHSRRSALAQRDVPVELVAVARGRPPGAAWNAALRGATGDWIAFLDEGDWWLPDRLLRQLADPAARDAVLAYAGRVVTDREGRLLEYALAPNPSELPQQLRLFDALGSPAGVLVRAAALRAVGGFDERLSIFSTWRLWIDILRCGSAAGCPDLLVAEVSRHPRPALRAPSRALADLRMLGREGAIDAGTPLRVGIGLAQELVGLGRRRQAAEIYLRGALGHARVQDAVRAAAVLLRRPAREIESPQLVAPDWLPQPPRAR